MAAMTDTAVLGHAARMDDCAGDKYAPPADLLTAPLAIRTRRGLAPTRAAVNFLVPRALSTAEDPLDVAILACVTRASTQSVRATTLPCRANPLAAPPDKEEVGSHGSRIKLTYTAAVVPHPSGPAG